MCATLGIIYIQHGHDWGGDFSMYIAQAQAILNNSTQELFEGNTFTIQNSDITIGPYLYPLGFPLIITPVIHFFGTHFYLLKLITLTILLTSIYLSFHLFGKKFKDRLSQFCFLFILCTHPYLITYCDLILPDIYILFISLFCLILIPRVSKQPLFIIPFAILCFLCFILKPIGIFLIFSIAAYLFQQKK